MERTEKKVFTVREITFTALFTALLAICSWISIPLTVPITLQTFAVFAAILLLGTKCSFTAILAWILLGMAGVPVFSGFKGGIGVLAGVTGGYIVGFLICPFIALGVCKLFGKLEDSVPVKALACVIALIVCYAFGSAWFILVYAKGGDAVTIGYVLKICVLPFAVFDLIKIGIALFLENRAKKFRFSIN